MHIGPNVLLRRLPKVASFPGHRSADLPATHTHHELMRGLHVMKGAWHPAVTKAPTPEVV